jgi:hypothetical protein
MLNEIQLTRLKSQWQEMLIESITDTLKAIEEHMPEQASKHNALLVLKARLNEVNQQKIMRVLSQEQLSLAYNKLRYDILDFIDHLATTDFAPATVPLGTAPAGPRRGTLLHKIPRKMAVGHEEECIIRIAYERTIIANDLDITEEVEVKEITISKIMQAELIDPNDEPAFKIRTFADEEQFLQEGEYTEWKFFVTPLREGAHELLLKISVVEVIEGKERTRNISWEEQVHIVSANKEVEEAIFQNSGVQLAFEEQKGSTIPMPPGTKQDLFQDITRSLVDPQEFIPSPAPAPQTAPSTSKKKKSRISTLSIATSLAIAIGVGLFVGLPNLTNVDSSKEEDTPNSIIVPSEKNDPDTYKPGEVKMSVEEAWAITLENNNRETYQQFIKAYPDSEQAIEAKRRLKSLESQ